MSPRPTLRGGDGGYSAFVRVLKLTLPLIAGLLILSVIVWPDRTTRDRQFSIEFAKNKHLDAADPNMINPRYVGTDSNNRPYAITAELARSLLTEAPEIELQGIAADIPVRDGSRLALTAARGAYSRENETLDLSGAVSLRHESGYALATETMRLNLKTGVAHGASPITGQGPFGDLTADGFRIVDRGQTIFFTGRTRAVIPVVANGATLRPGQIAADGATP